MLFGGARRSLDLRVHDVFHLDDVAAGSLAPVGVGAEDEAGGEEAHPASFQKGVEQSHQVDAVIIGGVAPDAAAATFAVEHRADLDVMGGLAIDAVEVAVTNVAKLGAVVRAATSGTSMRRMNPQVISSIIVVDDGGNVAVGCNLFDDLVDLVEALHLHASPVGDPRMVDPRGKKYEP